MKKNFSFILIVLMALGFAYFLFFGIESLKPDLNGGTENFTSPVEVETGKAFGENKQLTFELYQNGTFIVDPEAGIATQVSREYSDSAIIRSTKPLPPAYKISVVVAEIDYELDAVAPMGQSRSGDMPGNENGVYLIAITDEIPNQPHENTWWHQHRKLVMDVDNNVWGSGMPHPIFMVYFDQDNELNAWDGRKQLWQGEWNKAVEYDPQAWYRIELEKNPADYVMSIFAEDGTLLSRSSVPISRVWHSELPEYFVMGDPHINYYQGSFKIKSITITPLEFET